MAIHRLGGRFHTIELVVWFGVEHREHDRVSRPPRAPGRRNDSDGFHVLVSLFPGATPSLFCGRHRHHRFRGAYARPGNWRLDNRHAELALAVLH